jgi:hypothetical protein
MRFEYTCFVSYRHLDSPQARNFQKKFLEALKGQMAVLNQNIKFFIDEQRLEPGYLFNEAIAEALCSSACMIVLFTPEYFSKDKTYCAREYRAMTGLEEKRLPDLNNRKLGLIIPIVIAGGNKLPDEIKNLRNFHDFSDYSLVPPDIIRNRKFNQRVAVIAAAINGLFQKLSQLQVDDEDGCGKFKIPTDDEIREWLDELLGSIPPDGLPL